MNKLSALSKLANAYHYVEETEGKVRGYETHTTDTISDKFNYIRRSLRIEDLKPEPKQPAEGLNPAGPKFF